MGVSALFLAEKRDVSMPDEKRRRVPSFGCGGETPPRQPRDGGATKGLAA